MKSQAFCLKKNNHTYKKHSQSASGLIAFEVGKHIQRNVPCSLIPLEFACGKRPRSVSSVPQPILDYSFKIIYILAPAVKPFSTALGRLTGMQRVLRQREKG